MMTWFIKHSYYIHRDVKKLSKARKKRFLKFTGTNIALWTICNFLLRTNLWNRGLFIMLWMQQWKCRVCGANDTCMNVQSVSENWPRKISYMNLPFSKENYVRVTADIFLNTCLCTYWPFITYELFYEIIEIKELSRLVV